ncbi:MAG: glycosyltransferase family 2 protein [Bacteroidaceae bacterium]|nr:glycosyltransferase family 2 protein [Bacteroidaceae bacterium]
MKSDTAVVILNYNGAEMLLRFLSSVVEHTPDARIVVADNGSTDNSLNVLRDNFPIVGVIELGANYGFAEGYNRALSQVEATYYVLLNSDVEVTHGWLTPIIDIMEADKSIAACQPKVLAYDKKTHFEYAGASGGFIDAYGYPFCRGRILDNVEEDKGQYDAPCRIFWATGAALVVRSEVFKRVGGFDGRFFAHMEEIDLCWRILARGGVIMALPVSVVYHIGGATLHKSNPRKTYLNFRNNLLMLYKNMPDERLRRAMRVRCLLDAVAAIKFLLTGEWGNFKAVLMARRDFKRVKKDFAASRAENLSETKTDTLARMCNFSILWRYYAKGIRSFSQLFINQ